MDWISVEDKYPESSWHIVFTTDGITTRLAQWIEDPKKYYGDDLMDYDIETDKETPLEKEWHSPHWIFIQGVGPFIGNDECCAFNSDEISHWMPLPRPPKQ
jgi:hypothetical protein